MNKKESEVKAKLWNCIKEGRNFADYSNAVQLIKVFTWHRKLFVGPKESEKEEQGRLHFVAKVLSNL